MAGSGRWEKEGGGKVQVFYCEICDPNVTRDGLLRLGNNLCKIKKKMKSKNT